MHLIKYSIQSENNWKTLPGKDHFKILNLQHCNFMIINFMYFRILIRVTQYLDKRAGLVLHCSE
jgi:hypothetical protein